MYIYISSLYQVACTSFLLPLPHTGTYNPLIDGKIACACHSQELNAIHDHRA